MFKAFTNNKRLPGLLLISILLILILGGLLGYQYLYLPRLTTLFVNTDPSDATVFIDGKEVGKTPYQNDVWKGKHTVKVEKDGVVQEETEDYTDLMYSINKVLKPQSSETTPAQ